MYLDDYIRKKKKKKKKKTIIIIKLKREREGDYLDFLFTFYLVNYYQYKTIQINKNNLFFLNFIFFIIRIIF
jgi:hypothetical protein